ncbi:hypothetical protein [Tissierella creatinophila]|uniref:Uncharacterized protein n=1 Tax=Tissierella creatinophila DSM 6911 TaxID=1123403 RepID=A0A1U7M8E9_TISCR|nr:hypothetical protein [Tissierella creatinophila]OLS03592.1 hypothetical protein TICRE_04490 [Tissierella creatinophila DSM 6911]
MNTMIKKFVDTGMMTEEQGKFIEEAIMRKDSIVVSGHRSAGIRPLMASLMGVAKSNFTNVQVKGFEDLEKDVEFFLIPGLDDIDFEKLISDAISKPNTAFVSLKEPEHPVSLMKVLRQNFKNGTGIGKRIQTLECVKENDEAKLAKITEMYLDEKGKVKKQDH